MSNRSSIVCDVAVSERLNELAALLDSRLFLFAYYNPKPIAEDASGYVKFHIAILNIYGLLHDCGPFVRTRLVKLDTNSIIYEHQGRKNQDIVRRFEMLDRFVTAYRSCHCHNNADSFIFNRQHIEYLNDHQMSFTSINRSFSQYSDVDWNKAYIALRSQADRVASDIEECLKRLLAPSGENKRHQVIEYWLASIADWYVNDKQLSYNVLADIYFNKFYDKYNRRVHITQTRVKNWIMDSDGNESLTQWLKEIPFFIDSQNCPEPALPCEFLHHIFSKAQLYDVSR